MTRPGRLTWLDVALPVGIAVLGAIELVALRTDGWGAGIACEVVACTLLVWRRRHTLVACTLALLVLLLMPYLGVALDQPAVPIMVLAAAIYALGRWIAGLQGVIGLAVVLVMMLGDYLFADARAHNLSDVMFVSALTLPPLVLGRVVRRLAEQKALLEDRQELIRRDAVRTERDRIAREMHDVITHSISAMVVQTAAAQDLVRSDPGRAEEVLADVADTGRRAIAETGRLLHVLRDEDDELGLEPAPGLADLPGLVEAFRASGLQVELVAPDPLPSLPAGVDVSAYRIVQEALTNALRYGADRTARLHLDAPPGRLVIHASNPSSGRTGSGSGLGLLGLGERVSLLGGRLTHGVREDGCFELSATLPVAP